VVKILINKYKDKVFICTLVGIIAILVISMVGGVSAADKTITNSTNGGLKVAIDTIGDNETVFLENGVYSGENNIGIDINKDLTIYGKGNNVVIDAKGKSRIFYISSKCKITLKNLKLINGNYYIGGGAIYNQGSLFLSGCTFTNNQAIDSQIQNGQGGAVCNYYGNITISDSTFNSNQAKNGGAVYNYYGNIYISGSYFITNNAKDCGGAIYNNNLLSVKNSIFNGNFANSDILSHGGAIHNLKGELSVENSNFTNNKAQYGGAIGSGTSRGYEYSLNDHKIFISNSLFENNYANGVGGAIYLASTSYLLRGNNITFYDDITVSITNSIFNNNSGKSDGAISIYGSSSFISGGIVYRYKPEGAYYKTITKVSITNSAFNNNKASYEGGAIGGVNDAEIKITKTVFKNNIIVSKNIYNAIDPYLRVILSKDVSITPAEGTKVGSTTAKKSDLKISKIKKSGNYRYVYIKNVGKATAGKSYLGVYVGKKKIKTIKVTSIKAGKYLKIKVTIAKKYKNKQKVFKVDIKNTVKESNEKNNSLKAK
jgi:hypothetical protein